MKVTFTDNSILSHEGDRLEPQQTNNSKYESKLHIQTLNNFSLTYKHEHDYQIGTQSLKQN